MTRSVGGPTNEVMTASKGIFCGTPDMNSIVVAVLNGGERLSDTVVRTSGGERSESDNDVKMDVVVRKRSVIAILFCCKSVGMVGIGVVEMVISRLFIIKRLVNDFITLLINV